MAQLPNEVGMSRSTDPVTSGKAASRASVARQQRYAEILFFVGTYPEPVNNEDIANALGVSQIGSISPRVSELLRLGKLAEAGIKKNSRNISMRAVVLA